MKSSRLPTRFIRGFTLIELLVAVAIIALLIAMLLPSPAKARTTAQKAACMAKLRAVGRDFVIYTAQWDDRFPMFGAAVAPTMADSSAW